ncbi:hypothetical protein EZ428_01475 [Pedobacter frigiditerrae]|uniref:Uncharacterized protein n=1 Tax=Pedobacter frigiditerrae TaxID=2530452 RepID=A0A4R0N2A7_9SPHI|nr:DUF2807 domain-containing protein [Pedobacter frigiditerrae]TCC93467.1 hypothetical protein EZ428_01475 [Pedobacter frigiditerrae]
MKLSNKLLIAFAASLILIPFFGMIFVSATMYKTGTYKENVLKIENFSTPTKNMESLAISSPFESVNIADAKGMVLNVQFIKDDKFGVKIQDDLKGLVTATVDTNGQLQIVIKDKPKSEENRHRYYINIYVYSPTIKSLNVSNANDINIMAVTDTLSLSIQKSTGISFDSETHIKQLNVKTADVEGIRFREDDIKSIKLDLHNTNFYSEESSFENVSITTNGKCEIEFIGDRDVQNKYTINNLSLITNGIADVKLGNIKVSNCSGKLSDETQVQMPAVNLNQMYKK